MRAYFRNLFVAVAAAATIGASAAINAPSAGAAPQDCQASSPGVHQCTSPGHAQIHVPPPPAPRYPNFQTGPNGGPPHLPWIG